MTTGCLFKEVKEIYGDEIFAIMDFCAMNDGVVHSDRDCFICAYPTTKKSIETKSKKGLDLADTWYVYIAAGNLKTAFEVGQKLKYVAFKRMDDRIRVYDYDRIRRLIDGRH